MATIYDIAKAAGVSTATVSRVLNGSPRVSENTKEKVMAAIRAADYSPNAFAQGLGLHSMKSVGILCTDASDPFFSAVIRHLEDQLRLNGYHCILTCTGSALCDKQDRLQLLLSKHVDAVIILGSAFMEQDPLDRTYILEAANRIPLIFLNGHLDHPGIYCIENDAYESILYVTERLLSAGCRKPVFLYNRDSFGSQRKLQGFQRALEQHGVSGEVISCPDGIRAAAAFLEKAVPPGTDCAVCAHDETAVAFLKYAHRCNIRVPEECAIVGHGDLMLAQCCEPELTTIDLHIDQLCAVAAAHLMTLFSGGQPPHYTTIPGTVLPGGTTPAGIFD